MTGFTDSGIVVTREASLDVGHREILEALPEGVVVIDTDGCIAYVNATACRMLGYAAHELLGVPGHATLHHTHADGTPYPPEECPTRESLHERRIARVRATDGEVFWRKDGTSFPVYYISGPILHDGVVQGAAIVFTDATERLRRQDERVAVHREAAEVEKVSAMGTLVSGVSHEVKTPLTILLNNAFLLRHKVEKHAAASPDARALRDDVAAHLGEIDAAVDRMTTLVNELRRFSRLDETEVAPMLLEDAVDEAAQLFRLAFASTVRVELDLHETRPVLIDPRKVQQLTLNLLQNAAEATMDRGGTVRARVRLDDAGANALLEVEDEGLGVPDEVRARMYEPLFTTKEHASGLGLAIVKRIVDEHGATIACESEMGHGTRFRVAFPLASYE